MSKVETLVVDNFRGGLTLYQYGDINSGRSWVQSSAGQNPFVKPGQLTWNEAATQIDSEGDVITDLIVAGKGKIENGIMYTYAIGHTGRLYKIQSNDPATYNPDYDNPVLLTTLTAESPTFTRGGFIEFFGSTERIYISHDKGVTRVDFDGTNETFVGSTSSWVQNVPRPMEQFIGKLYIGNGPNLAEIDSTATVTTYTKLSPGFPDNTQIRDIDALPDGNYLQAVVSLLPLYDITAASQETISTASVGSYVFLWNGIDAGYTSYTTFPSFSIGTNLSFGNYQYLFGSDQYGTAVYSQNEKIITVPESPIPLPNAVNSTGNMFSWMNPIYYLDVLELDYIVWGSLDFEVGYPGWWDLFFINATAPETDIVRSPFQMPVSNVGIGASSNNYTANVFSNSKIYFSTLESSSTPTTAYRFYKWIATTSPDVPTDNVLTNTVYQTQSQMFSKKVTIKEVRIYGEPWIAGNSFYVAIMGSNSEAPMTGGDYTFEAGTNLTVGDDFAWYTPSCAPTYVVGLLISNLGHTNHTINKIEVDYTIGGK